MVLKNPNKTNQNRVNKPNSTLPFSQSCVVDKSKHSTNHRCRSTSSVNQIECTVDCDDI